jgi:hypothetical protein
VDKRLDKAVSLLLGIGFERRVLSLESGEIDEGLKSADTFFVLLLHQEEAAF